MRFLCAWWGRLALGLVCGLALTIAGPVPGAGNRASADERLPAPAVAPLVGPLRILRGFDPPAQRWLAGHRGVDLGARAGDPVLAAADGTVSFAGRVGGRPVLSIDHGGGFSTTYEPVTALVSRGQQVWRGEQIGAIGAGGHCSRRCLHWGLREAGGYRNPLDLLRAGGPVRLVPTNRRAQVIREARQRAAAARAAWRRTQRTGRFGLRRPVAGPVTSPFGRRFHPIRHVWKLHDGTDFGARCGAPIHAPADGRVLRVTRHPAYGKRLFLDHGVVRGHRLVTAYNHASSYAVRPGHRVRAGQLIGRVGSTGSSTGCHLHLMVWVAGRLVDPMTVL